MPKTVKSHKRRGFTSNLGFHDVGQGGNWCRPNASVPGEIVSCCRSRRFLRMGWNLSTKQSKCYPRCLIPMRGCHMQAWCVWTINYRREWREQGRSHWTHAKTRNQTTRHLSILPTSKRDGGTGAQTNHWCSCKDNQRRPRELGQEPLCRCLGWQNYNTF